MAGSRTVAQEVDELKGLLCKSFADKAKHSKLEANSAKTWLEQASSPDATPEKIFESVYKLEKQNRRYQQEEADEKLIKEQWIQNLRSYADTLKKSKKLPDIFYNELIKTNDERINTWIENELSAKAVVDRVVAKLDNPKIEDFNDPKDPFAVKIFAYNLRKALLQREVDNHEVLASRLLLEKLNVESPEFDENFVRDLIENNKDKTFEDLSKDILFNKSNSLPEWNKLFGKRADNVEHSSIFNSQQLMKNLRRSQDTIPLSFLKRLAQDKNADKYAYYINQLYDVTAKYHEMSRSYDLLAKLEYKNELLPSAKKQFIDLLKHSKGYGALSDVLKKEIDNDNLTIPDDKSVADVISDFESITKNKDLDKVKGLMQQYALQAPSVEAKVAAPPPEAKKRVSNADDNPISPASLSSARRDEPPVPPPLDKKAHDIDMDDPVVDDPLDDDEKEAPKSKFSDQNKLIEIYSALEEEKTPEDEIYKTVGKVVYESLPNQTLFSQAVKDLFKPEINIDIYAEWQRAKVSKLVKHLEELTDSALNLKAMTELVGEDGLGIKDEKAAESIATQQLIHNTIQLLQHRKLKIQGGLYGDKELEKTMHQGLAKEVRDNLPEILGKMIAMDLTSNDPSKIDVNYLANRLERGMLNCLTSPSMHAGLLSQAEISAQAKQNIINYGVSEGRSDEAMQALVNRTPIDYTAKNNKTKKISELWNAEFKERKDETAEVIKWAEEMRKRAKNKGGDSYFKNHPAQADVILAAEFEKLRDVVKTQWKGIKDKNNDDAKLAATLQPLNKVLTGAALEKDAVARDLLKDKNLLQALIEENQKDQLNVRDPDKLAKFYSDKTVQAQVKKSKKSMPELLTDWPKVKSEFLKFHHRSISDKVKPVDFKEQAVKHTQNLRDYKNAFLLYKNSLGKVGMGNADARAALDRRLQNALHEVDESLREMEALERGLDDLRTKGTHRLQEYHAGRYDVDATKFNAGMSFAECAEKFFKDQLGAPQIEARKKEIEKAEADAKGGVHAVAEEVKGLGPVAAIAVMEDKAIDEMDEKEGDAEKKLDEAKYGQSKLELVDVSSGRGFKTIPFREPIEGESAANIAKIPQGFLAMKLDGLKAKEAYLFLEAEGKKELGIKDDKKSEDTEGFVDSSGRWGFSRVKVPSPEIMALVENAIPADMLDPSRYNKKSEEKFVIKKGTRPAFAAAIAIHCMRHGIDYVNRTGKLLNVPSKADVDNYYRKKEVLSKNTKVVEEGSKPAPKPGG